MILGISLLSLDVYWLSSLSLGETPQNILIPWLTPPPIKFPLLSPQPMTPPYQTDSPPYIPVSSGFSNSPTLVSSHRTPSSGESLDYFAPGPHCKPMYIQWGILKEVYHKSYQQVLQTTPGYQTYQKRGA